MIAVDFGSLDYVASAKLGGREREGQLASVRGEITARSPFSFGACHPGYKTISANHVITDSAFHMFVVFLFCKRT